jgi:hypothetical protein
MLIRPKASSAQKRFRGTTQACVRPYVRTPHWAIRLARNIQRHCERRASQNKLRNVLKQIDERNMMEQRLTIREPENHLSVINVKFGFRRRPTTCDYRHSTVLGYCADLFAYHVDYILDDNAPVMSEAFLQPARLNACRRSRTGSLLVNLVKPFPRSRITSNRTPRMVVDQACSPITRSRDAARTSSVAAFTLYK